MKSITIDRLTTSVFVLFIFLYLSTAGLIIIPFLGMLSKLSFVCITIIIFLLLSKYKNLNLRELKILLPFILFELIYIFNYNSFSRSGTFFNIFYQAFFIVMWYIVSSIIWKRKHIKLFSLIYWLMFPILLLIVIISPESVSTNRVGAYSYFLTFFSLLYIIGYTKNFKLFRVFCLVLSSGVIIYLSHTRSVLVSAVFGLITWMLWKIITKNKLLFNFYFILILVFGYLFTVVYPRLDTVLDNFYYYNDLVYQYTGKNILSGRDKLWSELLVLIENKPFFGYGSGALPSDFINTNLSSHNLYIQIALQVGIVGLSVFLLFLFFVWKTLWLNRHDSKVILSACYFIGILIHQLFEVTFTQNNFGLSIIQWLILGFGTSYCINTKNIRHHS
jgi:O-antigen ligase